MARIAESQHKLIGTFHSHPISQPLPGNRDREAMVFAEGYQLIYDVCGVAAKLWKATDATNIQEVPLKIDERIGLANKIDSN